MKKQDDFHTKENFDTNLNLSHKKAITQNHPDISLIIEERVFGKNIKNAVQQNLTSLANFNCKNIAHINEKKKKVEKKTNPHAIEQEEAFTNLEALENKNIEDSQVLSLPQIFPDQNNNQSFSREYKEVSLGNSSYDNYVKVGKFFLRRSGTTLSSKTKDIMSTTSHDAQIKPFASINKNKDECFLHCDLLVKDDPQYSVEYVNDIFKHLKHTERINGATWGYMSTVQDDITDKMRAILIDWIIEVHLKFKLNPETLYMTVNLIDRYLAVKRIDRTRLQLVAVAAMLIASKYEEIYAPEVRDFVYITDKTYTKEEIIQMEYQMLSNLNFDILQVSPYIFLQRYHDATGEPKNVFYMAQYILEFSLVEYQMLIYDSSVRALASLFIARRLLQMDHSWPQDLPKVPMCTMKELKPCVKDLCKILEFLPRMKLKACIVKFSTQKFMEVAKINIFNN